MRQMGLFEEIDLQEIRKEVLSEFTRIAGESDDEWEELIRIEIDYRIKEYRKDKPHPDYSPKSIKK